jgi:peptidoglycan/xylan/chitin deacetylase (PgdA/CDA1 family)
MVRGLIKTGLASALYRSGADRLIAGLAGQRAAVVGYHRVVDDFATHAAYSIPAMLTSRSMLERHLDWIARRFQIINLEELPKKTGSHASARPMVAITFDDGYRDVYEHAFPLLKRMGIPATVFVSTDWIGASRALPHDRLYQSLQRARAGWPLLPREWPHLLRRLDIAMSDAAVTALSHSSYAALRGLVTTLAQGDLLRVIDALEAEVGASDEGPRGCRPLTWEMVAEMSAAGIDIGSHTKSHVLLTNENRKTVVDETFGSRQQLESRLGRSVTCFAYPDGRFDDAAVAAVAAAGYRIAVTTCRHCDRDYPLLTVPRVMLWERSSIGASGRFSASILSCQLNAILPDGAACRQPHMSTHSVYARTRAV